MTKRRDMFTSKKRSEVMTRIRSKYTKLDLAMRDLFIDHNIEFQMYPDVYGKPDFLLSPNITLFCDSSFWHGKNWPALKEQLSSGSRASYWVDHIMSNRRRDLAVNRTLRKQGFVVLRFWDTDIQSNSEACIKKIEEAMSRSVKDHPSRMGN